MCVSAHAPYFSHSSRPQDRNLTVPSRALTWEVVICFPPLPVSVRMPLLPSLCRRRNQSICRCGIIIVSSLRHSRSSLRFHKVSRPGDYLGPTPSLRQISRLRKGLNSGIKTALHDVGSKRKLWSSHKLRLRHLFLPRHKLLSMMMTKVGGYFTSVTWVSVLFLHGTPNANLQ